MRNVRGWMLALLAALLAGAANGQAAKPEDRPFVSPVFGSHMVLQRDRPLSVWGWTTPGVTVAVSINGQFVRAVAGADGRWTATLTPMRAGGPYRMTIEGGQKATLEDVLIGDVWVCSGQSNMEMGIANVDNASQEIAAANDPQLRLYTVPKAIALEPQEIARGSWEVCTPGTVSSGGWGGFSAVGYFFGRKLRQELKVPVGLIHTSWGGTVAEAWTSERALRQMKDFVPALDQLAQLRTEIRQASYSYDRMLAEWWEKNDPGSRGEAWAAAALDTAQWKSMTLPAAWEEAGLPDYDGVVWFRRSFDVPAAAAGKDAKLRLGPIDDADTTWVNGVRVGSTAEYNTPREYTIPANVLHAGANTIAVRVLDTGGAGGLWGKPEQLSVTFANGTSAPLNGPWLYRASVDLKQAPALPIRADNDPNHTTVLYNGMIAPLIPYGIKGAIWYQGESNADRAAQYRTLLPAMIGDWRSRWAEGDFPFLIVQLANFMETKPEPGEDGWAELREAQLRTAQSVPKTGLAVPIDIGDAKDIHPKNKQDVGLRLALNALAIAYGQKIAYSGPIYREMKREGGTIRLSFDHVEGGLDAKGGTLKGFAVAGADRKWVWADAKIDGDTVVVSAAGVAEPVAVRYAWAINPVCNLYNRAGLPASPFRTEDWTVAK